MQRVIVHIDKLVLKGIRQEDRNAFAQGLHEELSRQLSEPDVLQHLLAGGNLPKLDTGAVAVNAAGGAAGVGEAAARRIAQGGKS